MSGDAAVVFSARIDPNVERLTRELLLALRDSVGPDLSPEDLSVLRRGLYEVAHALSDSIGLRVVRVGSIEDRPFFAQNYVTDRLYDTIAEVRSIAQARAQS